MLHGVVCQSFVGRVWSNGQFGIARSKDISVGRLKVRKTSGKVAETLLDISVHGVLATLAYSREPDEYFRSGEGLLPVPSTSEPRQNDLVPIGSSLRPNSHKRGEGGITSHGRKLVRCAAKELQDRYGKSCLSFLTLTLPGMDADDLRLVAESWSEVVRVFCQKLKRHLIKGGLDGEIVGVTEIQEKRLSSGNGYALHLHLLFQGALIRYQWVYAPSVYRELWASVLEQYVPRSRWSDDRALENVKSVRHSCEGYLGKYMSKGVGSLQRVKSLCPDAPIPSSWYVCTMNLRRKVLRAVCHVNSISAAYLVELIETCPDLFQYCRPVRVRMGDRDVGVGWCGKLRDDRLKEIRETLYALKETRLSGI